ncbi:hypothetical protein ACWEWI_26445 [Streptomyces sp. NPDC003753]|uniref:hypothetical protein n=1 Tax=Streptomyces sp. NPDC058960 TaxID=3346679 RepID=UPI0036A9ABBA
MPAHESIPLVVSVVVAAVATGLWVIGLFQMHRQYRKGVMRRGTLRGVPRQRWTAPHWDSVHLTPAERDAFAHLVRRFRDGRSQGHSGS